VDLAKLEQALQSVRGRFANAEPTIALILGSGWGSVTDLFDLLQTVPYADIPGLGAPQTEGHEGRLLLLGVDGTRMLAFKGRRHFYEGAGWEPVAIPVRIAAGLGVSSILLTNAAGGVRSDLAPGTLMAIEDHINAMGANPLLGNPGPPWTTRFPDQSAVYDPDLLRRLDDAAAAEGIELAHGTYLATSGPAYETPAEIRAFAALGADAVGMSTVPEAMLASAAGLRVAALSCITNTAAGLSASPLSHEEVVEETRRAAPRMRRLVATYVRRVLFSPP